MEDRDRVALGMYHEDPLPAGLYDRLERIHHYCILAGGELRSRQVIATVIVQW